MKSFTDTEGRSWEITVNVDTIKRVRGLLDVDLLDIVTGKLIERLCGDPVLLCDVVYVICKPQAEQRNVSDEDFGRVMAGDAIEAATKALLDELVNFSPSPKDRANLQRVMMAVWGAMDKARDAVGTRLDSGELENVIDQALSSAGLSSGSVPESPTSTPDP